MRVYDVEFDFIIIVQRLSSLLEIIPVQAVKLNGKIIYQLEKWPLQIEIDDEYQISRKPNNEEDLYRKSRVLVLLQLEHRIQLVLVLLSGLVGHLVQGERGQEGGLRDGLVVLHLFRKKMRRRRIFTDRRFTSLYLLL